VRQWSGCSAHAAARSAVAHQQGKDKSDAADAQLSSVIVVPDVVSSNEEKVSEADGDQGGAVVAAAAAAADATESPTAGADPPSSPSAATSSEPAAPAPAPAPVPRVSVSLPPPTDPVFDAAFAPGSSFMYVQVGLQLMHGTSILSSLHGDQSRWHRYEEFYARLLNGGCVSLFIPLVLSLNRMVHPRSQKLDLEEDAIEHAMSSGGVGHYVLSFLLLSIYPPMFTHLVPAFCFLPVIGLFLVALKTQDWLAELAKSVPARQRILEQLKAQRDALPALTAEEQRVYDLTPDLRMFELAASLPPAVVSYRANDVAVDAVGTLHWGFQPMRASSSLWWSPPCSTPERRWASTIPSCCTGGDNISTASEENGRCIPCRRDCARPCSLSCPTYDVGCHLSLRHVVVSFLQHSSTRSSSISPRSSERASERKHAWV
jgi:hypothetical protein